MSDSQWLQVSHDNENALLSQNLTLGSQCFDYLPEACFVVDPFNDVVVHSNALGRDLWLRCKGGREASQNECVDRVFSSWFGDQMPHLVLFTQQALEQGEAWSDELSLVCADGERLSIEMNIRRVELGENTLLIFLLRDASTVHERHNQSALNRYHRGGLIQWRRMEQVFQDIERENQLILNAAGEGIYGVDVEGKTTFMNPAAEKMLGYDAVEVVGQNMHALIHHSHENGHHFHEEACPIFTSFRDGEIRNVDNECFWRKDGSYFPVEYTSTPIRDNGQLVGAVVLFRDVSERKEAESNLKMALEEVRKLKQQLELENAYLKEELGEEYNYHEIVGKSEAVRNIIQKIEWVAPTDANVLICGETGTGKELIARAIHQRSERCNRPLIRVNCAAIPKELFESEFFGHIKGAFTGALAHRVGRFELADGGTLFLDEVGEIPLDLQGKLLRVLQDQQFERVGDVQTRRVNVRVIAATNRNLAQAVEEKTFREDLYFRLNVFPIESAPLRKRIVDIPLLASHFLKKACQKFNKPQLRLSVADTTALCAYAWPGNIRELENVIERQVILCRGKRLHFDLPSEAFNQVKTDQTEPEPLNSAGATEVLTEDDRRQGERMNIVNALKRSRGKVFGPQGAAEILQVKPTTLASRIKRYRINPAEFKVA
ncbi:MAG: sigma 54-interacting transcriptional regulator [Pseudomonadales bacterium]|nr:sigma 54-interacting transcriptional regulator [Pseudomonadales bacterium]